MHPCCMRMLNGSFQVADFYSNEGTWKKNCHFPMVQFTVWLVQCNPTKIRLESEITLFCCSFARNPWRRALHFSGTWYQILSVQGSETGWDHNPHPYSVRGYTCHLAQNELYCTLWDRYWKDADFSTACTSRSVSWPDHPDSCANSRTSCPNALSSCKASWNTEEQQEDLCSFLWNRWTSHITGVYGC